MKKPASPVAPQSLQRALALHQSGQFSSAIREYGSILAVDPRHFDAQQLLGLCYLQIGKPGEALKFLNAALRMRSDIASVFNHRGIALRALGRHADSLSDFDTALRLKANYADACFNKGNALRDLRRLKDAKSCYESAVQLEPKRVEFINNLAGLLSELNQNEDAIRYYDLLANLRPKDPEFHLNRGLVLTKLGRFEDAVASYDLVIEVSPGSAEAYSGRGDCLREMGRFGEALASCDYALKLKPNLGEAYCSHGAVLKELGRLDEALASYDKAISLKPDYAEAYCNRGAILKELGRLDEARASHERAIGLDSDFALAWVGLAEIDSETGQFEEAEVKYQKAHLLDPKAVAPLSGVAEVKRFRSGDPLVQKIQELLMDGLLSTKDRAQLHHAFAKICNDLGRYDDAIENYLLGKKLLKSTFDSKQHGENYAAVKQFFTRQFFAERRNFGILDERPVFIVGMPRSGTTLTEQILASHPRVMGMGELPHVSRIAKGIGWGSGESTDFLDAISNLRPEDVTAVAEDYREAYSRSDSHHTRLVDKMPHNFQWLGLIALMFPNARVIHCTRNALDTCVSVYMQNFIDKYHWARDFTALGKYYSEYESLMAHWRQVLPIPLHICSYEETVADLEASARSMLSFLGLDWDPNCLNFYKQDGQIRTASLWQVRQPLYDDSVGRWKRYEKHLDPLKEALGIG